MYVLLCVCACGRSKSFTDLMNKCLVKDPSGRASAQDLLDHPFIADVTNHRPLRILYQVSGCGMWWVETGSQGREILSVVILTDVLCVCVCMWCVCVCVCV